MKWVLKSTGLRLGSLLLAIVLIGNLRTVSVYAMDEGTYTVPLTVTYANPQTGEILDSGSNEALGNSMCQSVMQTDGLIENNGEVTYVTLGFGLASNISNVEVLVQQTAGYKDYVSVPLTQTGTCERNGDTCIHYRFEISDPQLLISSVLFVEPMGRNVQFFIQLDTASAAEGMGNYVSEMMAAEEPDETVEEIQLEPESESKPETEQESVPEPEPVEEESSEIKSEEEEIQPAEDETKSTWIIPAVIAVVILAGGAVLIYKKRRKEEK